MSPPAALESRCASTSPGTSLAEPRQRSIESRPLSPALPGRYDLIVCNPPYVTDASYGCAARPSTGPSRPWPWPVVPTAMDVVRRIVAERSRRT